MRDVLRLLQAQREAERLFVVEVAGAAEPATGWSPAMTMFHLGKWRDRLRFALTEAAAERPINAPPGDIDEFNDAEMVGAAGVSLADSAARSDAALASIITLWETMGDRPFNWYTASTTAEAIIRNSYVHPRIHLSEQFAERGDAARSHAILEQTADEMRRTDAPPHILGAALVNLASVRLAEGRPDEALALLEEGLPMRPDLRAAVAAEPAFAPLRDSPRFRPVIGA